MAKANMDIAPSHGGAALRTVRQRRHRAKRL